MGVAEGSTGNDLEKELVRKVEQFEAGVHGLKVKKSALEGRGH